MAGHAERIETHGTPKQETIGELISRLATDSAALVREEVALAKQEVRENVRTLTSNVAVLATGTVIAVLAVATLIAAAVIGLGHEIGYGTSALVVGIALAVLGGIALAIGVRKIKHSSLKPEKTIETLEEGKRWVKDLT